MTAAPTHLELRLTVEIVGAIVFDGSAERALANAAELRGLIASALAEHRARIVATAQGFFPDHDFGMSLDALDQLEGGWTPEQVRSLIKAHRGLIQYITRARELLPSAVAGEWQGKKVPFTAYADTPTPTEDDGPG